jgi:hypothetical protein
MIGPAIFGNGEYLTSFLLGKVYHSQNSTVLNARAEKSLV